MTAARVPRRRRSPTTRLPLARTVDRSPSGENPLKGDCRPVERGGPPRRARSVPTPALRRLTRLPPRHDLAVRRDALVFVRLLGGKSTNWNLRVSVLRDVMDVVAMRNLPKPLVPVRIDHFSHEDPKEDQKDGSSHPLPPAPGEGRGLGGRRIGHDRRQRRLNSRSALQGHGGNLVRFRPTIAEA